MISLFTTLPVLALAVQNPQVDSLRALARDGPDSVLVEQVRQHPYDARDALHRLFVVGVRDDSAGRAALAAAGRLAGAVAVAWSDSFLVRQVSRFQSLTLADRQATLAADSVRRAGDDALGPKGIDVAVQLCRESLRRYEALNDTAGVARTLGDLGDAFFRAQEYDSAEVYLVRSRDLSERTGNYSTLGQDLAHLAIIRGARGDLQGASELLARAKPIRERTGDVRGLAGDQSNLGVIARARGDLAAARRAYEAALALSRRPELSTWNRRRELASVTLVNLGNIATLEGNNEEAAARYREALAIRLQIGDTLEAASALHMMGVIAFERGDYPTAVRNLSQATEIVQRLGPIGGSPVEPWLPLAQARGAMGDLQGARAELTRAEAFANRRRGAARAAALAQLALARGELAVTFNRLAEAEQQFTRAQRLTGGAQNASLRERVWLKAQYGLVDVLLRRESYHRAQVALEQLFRRSQRDVGADALIRVMSGQAAHGLRDTAAARRAFGEALAGFRTVGASADEAGVLGRLGDLEAQAGRVVAAESLYQAGLNRLGTRPAPGVAWPLHAGLAGLLRSRGALPDAAGELEAAITEIERVSGSLPVAEERAAFRADKWAPYVDLAFVERARGRAEAAFEASERLRARQMLDVLARGRIADSGAIRGLATREQDLRRRMAKLTDQLQRPGEAERGGLRDPAAVKAANAAANDALAHAQDAYGELLREMREANPAYAALVRGEIAPTREVMSALTPDEALLEYLVGDSTTVVFVVTRDTVAALDLKVSHNTLAAQVDFARSTLASEKEGAVRRAWRPSLRRLYRQLVAPVEATGLLAGKQRLLIAPHAELHYLPFAALVRSGPPEQVLVERYVPEYVTSASVWLRLRARAGAPARSGVLALAPRVAALPGSRAEVAAIGRIYGTQARVLVGPQATESAFRIFAPDQGIVHLATFGVLNQRNPLFSFVELGPGENQDGRLEVHEVFGLTLNARLLVLSACQTGVGAGALADVPPGDDWVGLVQGFLYAGASNVMATLWPVADVATARLMERFYRDLAAGRSEAEALALTQQAALSDPATAHPFFWAGFTLVRGR
jgi:CHAT domain-containing protein